MHAVCRSMGYLLGFVDDFQSDMDGVKFTGPQNLTKLTALTGVGILAGYMYYLYRTKGQLSIPGPKGYPFVGNAFQMQADKPHLTLSEWAEEYGDIMKINLFGEEIVVVNSYEGITEMLVTKSADFAARPFVYRVSCLQDDDGVAFGRFNQKWSVMKKCSMTGIKQVGDQLTELEATIIVYMDDFLSTLSSYGSSGRKVDLLHDIEAVISCITFTLVYGHQINPEEQDDYMVLHNYLNEKMGPTADNVELDVFPWLRAPWYGKYRELQKIAKRSRSFHSPHLAQTMQCHRVGQLTCALDGLINEMKQPSSDKFTPVSFGNIQAVALDLLQAGIATTVATLYYFIALMAVNPEYQQEAYENVIDAIGHRQAGLKDRFAIPYVESMILEITRYQSAVPFSLPHATTVDTSLCGYKIPKGTQILPNLWYLHHDSKVWSNPWEFIPSRFLDSEGRLVTADNYLRRHLYTFGAGRRVCVGESMAKNRLFLFITTLLQKFKFTVPENEIIDTDPKDFKLGITLQTHRFKVYVEPRT